MNPSHSRFYCPSFSLDLKHLLANPQRIVGIFGICAVAAHLTITQVGGPNTAQKATQPLTTQFIKRAPRLTKPLEMKKQPRPRKRRLQRQMIFVRARVNRREATSAFRATQVLQSLTQPSLSLKRYVGVQGSHFEMDAAAEVIEGSKDPASKMDISLEMLDIDALDTGQYHAMVIQNPNDKQAIKGFFRLATPYPPTLQLLTNNEVGTSAPMSSIVRAMNRYTDIRVELWKGFPIHSREVFKTPFIFLTANRTFDLTKAELENIGKYMLCGGFILADDDNAVPWGPVDVAFHRMFKDALEMQDKAQGRDWEFERLPDHHPLYHCFFDFDRLPPGNDEYYYRDSSIPKKDYLEEITIEDRLVALISSEDLTTIWTVWGVRGNSYPTVNPTRHYQLGVNIVIFALTQEGSITRQVMDGIQ